MKEMEESPNENIKLRSQYIEYLSLIEKSINEVNNELKSSNITSSQELVS